MKPDRVLLFYNPKAGNGIFTTYLDQIIETFQKKKMFVHPLRADHKDILERFFKNEDMSRYHRIIGAGGDGTINILVNAMIENDIHVPLAIFPSGTANDLAGYFGLPNEFNEILKIASEDHFTPMDVGRAGNKCFVNVLAMGMIVDVSQKTDPAVKNTLGVMAYYLKGLSEIPKLKPLPIRIKCPDREINTDIYAMLVMNGRSAGGFKNLSPDSEINDGMLDVVLIKDMPIANVAPFLVSIATGQHLDNKYVEHFKTNHMHIESEAIDTTDVDGESGSPLPFDVTVLPQRLSVCSPSDYEGGRSWYISL